MRRDASQRADAAADAAALYAHHNYGLPFTMLALITSNYFAD